jgi:hypothetical protein
VHTVPAMRSFLTLVPLVLALLPAVGWAAPWGPPAPKLQLALRHPRIATSAPGQRALREIPVAPESPGAYARVTHWVEAVALPAADGKPKLVVVGVPGGLALAWARRW